MDPFQELHDVDLVISSGRWSAEILDEVANFFHQLDDGLPPRMISDADSMVRNNSADIIPRVVPGT